MWQIIWENREMTFAAVCMAEHSRTLLEEITSAAAQAADISPGSALLMVSRGPVVRSKYNIPRISFHLTYSNTGNQGKQSHKGGYQLNKSTQGFQSCSHEIDVIGIIWPQIRLPKGTWNYIILKIRGYTDYTDWNQHSCYRKTACMSDWKSVCSSVVSPIWSQDEKGWTINASINALSLRHQLIILFY